MDQTQKQTPPLKTSDEAKSKGLSLAKKQGEAFKEAFQHMTHVADETSQKHVGDYLVSLAIEKAEGMYHLENNQLVWKNPTEQQNAHIEVGVQDASDERFIPGLNITVTVTGQNGKEIGTHQQPFLWHPWLYHYGRNWEVPREGVYSIKVHIDAPTFPRHDKKNGQRYAQPVDVEFNDIKIKPGRKTE